MSDEEFVRFFSRHLVSLAGWYRVENTKEDGLGQIQFFSYSGFILSIQGFWCLATAGHILNDLEQHLRDNSIRVIKYALLDDFGPNVISHDPIPFDYTKAPKYYIHDMEAGLDFALIGLGAYYQGLLEANGIVPVSKENWEKQNEVEFGYHMMLGLPQKLIESSTRKKQGTVHYDVSVRPITIDIEKLYKVPVGVKETSYPRFMGKVNDTLSLNDITGMSGGPILGFNKKGDKYWIVAIQSSLLPERNIIFGCPIPLIANLVEKMVADTSS
jgi:hypothetical protein